MKKGDEIYCESLVRYQRLNTREVKVGRLLMGGKHPIRIQSMTNTDTNDTQATVKQIVKIAKAGADLVRMTTRTQKEARNLKNIKNALAEKGWEIPLAADVHFNPSIAETAAKIVEKVRINPGNYAIGKQNKGSFKEIQKRFVRLLDICKENETALRIGVNHGSLSERIMKKYGNTPEGMVESAMEFLHICRKENFHNLVVSLKSSNTRVMVQANRMMVNRMIKEQMVYPLHLGVTEAGAGEDGRIKSAVGIGTLLSDGIGDTIRVSLTEAPKNEIPVAEKLIQNIQKKEEEEETPEMDGIPFSPFKYHKRDTLSVNKIGGTNDPVVVISAENAADLKRKKLKNYKPDFILKTNMRIDTGYFKKTPLIVSHEDWLKGNKKKVFPFFNSIGHFALSRKKSDKLNFIFTTLDEIDDLPKLKNKKPSVLLLQSLSLNESAEQRRFICELMEENINIPVIIYNMYREDDVEDLQVKASADTAPLFLDGLVEGICLQNNTGLAKETLQTAFGILQASRMRIFKTEFISCPGCGRTQFDLEKTTQEVKKKLGHLKGLKIAVMGCIVNGPGEMADADYGYVGSGKGKVTLYKKKEVIRKNVPSENAVEELKDVIRENGDWKEK